MKPFKIFSVFALLILLSSKISAQGASKPLQHVLLFDWKEDVEATQKEQILELFRGLVDKMEGFNTLSIKEVIKSSGNFDMVLILEFTSEDALKAYEVHPDHVKISEIAPPLLGDFSVFDFYGRF